MRAQEFINETVFDILQKEVDKVLSEELTRITELNIDNQSGWGQTPNNQEIDYMGLRVMMKPSKFLNLASNLTVDDSARSSIEKMKNHARTGGSFGAPTLYISVDEEWENGKFILPAWVTGHEGRHRMNAQLELEGNAPVETHLIISGWRNRDFTPDVIEALRNGMIKERTETWFIQGPLFTL
jgi:hypothetical protein